MSRRHVRDDLKLYLFFMINLILMQIRLFFIEVINSPIGVGKIQHPSQQQDCTAVQLYHVLQMFLLCEPMLMESDTESTRKSFLDLLFLSPNTPMCLAFFPLFFVVHSPETVVRWY